MLHRETIEPHTLELLISLQEKPLFKNLRLVGGTALALQLGHRKSIDLDLFGKMIPNEIEISRILQDFKNVKKLHNTPNIFIYSIEGVKVDFVNYHYDWLDDAIIEDGIIQADKKDIAAMKLSAISGRGTKKDFVDLYFLLKTYSLAEMVEFYNKKFTDGNIFQVLRSLVYFTDAENDHIKMINDVNWNTIKSTIKSRCDDFMKKNDFY